MGLSIAMIDGGDILAATRPNTKAQGNALGVAMRRFITTEIDCAFA
jgi:hypothetical protein